MAQAEQKSDVASLKLDQILHTLQQLTVERQEDRKMIKDLDRTLSNEVERLRGELDVVKNGGKQ